MTKLCDVSNWTRKCPNNAFSYVRFGWIARLFSHLGHVFMSYFVVIIYTKQVYHPSVLYWLYICACCVTNKENVMLYCLQYLLQLCHPSVLYWLYICACCVTYKENVMLYCLQYLLQLCHPSVLYWLYICACCVTYKENVMLYCLQYLLQVYHRLDLVDKCLQYLTMTSYIHTG